MGQKIKRVFADLYLTAGRPNHDVTESARKTALANATGAATNVASRVITPAIGAPGAGGALAASTGRYIVYGARCITIWTGSRGATVRTDMGTDEGK